MTISQIKNQIKVFKEKLPDFNDEAKDAFKQWEMELVKIERIQEVIRNPVMRDMVHEYRTEVEAINNRLSHEERMKEMVRIRLFARKNACQMFLNVFDIEERKEDLYNLIKNENDASK